MKKLVQADGPIPEQLIKELPAADAVIAGLEDYQPGTDRSGRETESYSRYGVGYDKVDLKAAADRQIMVTITPGANGIR